MQKKCSQLYREIANNDENIALLINVGKLVLTEFIGIVIFVWGIVFALPQIVLSGLKCSQLVQHDAFLSVSALKHNRNKSSDTILRERSESNKETFKLVLWGLKSHPGFRQLVDMSVHPTSCVWLCLFGISKSKCPFVPVWKYFNSIYPAIFLRGIWRQEFSIK